MKKKKKIYSEEFKREAIRLLETRGETTVASVAEGLGIRPSRLYEWRKELSGQSNTSDTSRNESPEQELKRLRRENAQLRKEKEVLKKSIAVCFQEIRL